jgi:hypothetical protein
VVGETLSFFPYNYEHANYLKRNSKPMLTTYTKNNNNVNDSEGNASPHHQTKQKQQQKQNQQQKGGPGNGQVWNSNFHFSCPIPNAVRTILEAQQQQQRHSSSTPQVYMDLVPIRTRPRYH